MSCNVHRNDVVTTFFFDNDVDLSCNLETGIRRFFFALLYEKSTSTQKKEKDYFHCDLFSFCFCLQCMLYYMGKNLDGKNISP